MFNKNYFSNQDSYLSNSCAESSQKAPKQRINTLWSKEENLIYIQFLKENRDIFISQEIRRHHKVFIQLAKLMPTRTSDQCRSHHQKMMISHKSIDKIIKHLNKKISKWEKKNKKSAVQTEIQTPVESQMEPEKLASQIEEISILQAHLKDFQCSFEQGLWDVLC